MTVSKTVDEGSSPSAPANKDTYSNIYVLSFLSNHLLSFYLPFFLMCLVSFIFAGIAQLGRAAGLYSVAPDKRQVAGSTPTTGTMRHG